MPEPDADERPCASCKHQEDCWNRCHLLLRWEARERRRKVNL